MLDVIRQQEVKWGITGWEVDLSPPPFQTRKNVGRKRSLSENASDHTNGKIAGPGECLKHSLSRNHHLLFNRVSGKQLPDVCGDLTALGFRHRIQ